MEKAFKRSKISRTIKNAFLVGMTAIVCSSLPVYAQTQTENIVGIPAAQEAAQRDGKAYTSRNDFINTIGPVIVRQAYLNGYDYPSAMIAQACCESAYGQSFLGYKYHNYFGMKAGGAWRGERVTCYTKEEYTPGVLTTITDDFRAFDNLEDGVKGYFNFLQYARYSDVIYATSAIDYISRLMADGYGTSTTYVNTIRGVIRDFNLERFDDENYVLDTFGIVAPSMEEKVMLREQKKTIEGDALLQGISELTYAESNYNGSKPIMEGETDPYWLIPDNRNEKETTTRDFTVECETTKIEVFYGSANNSAGIPVITFVSPNGNCYQAGNDGYYESSGVTITTRMATLSNYSDINCMVIYLEGLTIGEQWKISSEIDLYTNTFCMVEAEALNNWKDLYKDYRTQARKYIMFMTDKRSKYSIEDFTDMIKVEENPPQAPEEYVDEPKEPENPYLKYIKIGLIAFAVLAVVITAAVVYRKKTKSKVEAEKRKKMIEKANQKMREKKKADEEALDQVLNHYQRDYGDIKLEEGHVIQAPDHGNRPRRTFDDDMDNGEESGVERYVEIQKEKKKRQRMIYGYDEDDYLDDESIEALDVVKTMTSDTETASGTKPTAAAPAVKKAKTDKKKLSDTEKPVGTKKQKDTSEGILPVWATPRDGNVGKKAREDAIPEVTIEDGDEFPTIQGMETVTKPRKTAEGSEKTVKPVQQNAEKKKVVPVSNPNSKKTASGNTTAPGTIKEKSQTPLPPWMQSQTGQNRPGNGNFL